MTAGAFWRGMMHHDDSDWRPLLGGSTSAFSHVSGAMCYHHIQQRSVHVGVEQDTTSALVVPDDGTFIR